MLQRRYKETQEGEWIPPESAALSNGATLANVYAKIPQDMKYTANQQFFKQGVYS